MADEILEHPRELLHQGLKMIKSNSDQLLSLVNKMLDLSRLESGHLSLNLVQTDVLKQLRHILQSFQPLATNNEIQLSFTTEIDECLMDIDSEKIHMIISNLVDNAIKYSKPGGKIDINVEVSSDAEGNPYFSLSIKDKGIGISKDHLPYIFNRYFMTKSDPSRQSSGIGLDLTKELITLMRGQIEVQSTVGCGSEFIVRLPITRSAKVLQIDQDKLEKYDPIRVLSSSNGILNQDKKEDSPILLIIEDNQDVVQYLTTFLTHDYRVLVATNGKEGLNKAIDRVPDIIICDVMMPEMNGLEVVHILKNDERSSHIPIIMLTAKADLESKLQGLDVGADAFLTKPFNKAELEIRLHKMLELRSKLKARHQGHFSNQNTQTTSINVEDVFIQKVIVKIEENISDEHFKITQLCKALKISRTQLHRKLNALTNYSTSQFIRKVKMNKAMELLINSDHNISEIGYSVGYRNSSHFTQDFKMQHGQPPRHFRR
jgi:DNA-binding response OmpR family regulator/two-component sensor histidine kinase